MRKRLGELLIDAGLLDEHQLQAALGHQRQWGGRLGQALVHMQLISEDRMVRVLSQQLGIPVADPPPDDLHARVLGEISFELATQHHIFPLALRRDAKGEQLAIAMSDPTNVATLDAVQFTSGKKVVPFLAGDAAIESWIRRHYQGERPVVSSGLASTVAQASAHMGVQFGGQTVDLGSNDDDDIPVVTGAMMGAAAAAPQYDPFAALAPVAPLSAATPSARFAAPAQAAPAVLAGATPSGRFGNAPVAISGVATQAFAGTGALASLDPIGTTSGADAWARHVEQPKAVFGSAGSFLGADDEEEPALAAAFAAPVLVAPPALPVQPPMASTADPFALPAPPAFSPPALVAVELELTDAEDPGDVPAPAAPAPAVAAVIPPVGPSWGDLLDAPPAAVAPVPAVHIDVVPQAVAVAVAPSPLPAVSEATDFGGLPPTTLAPSENACPRCSNVRVGAARFCPFCGLSFVDAPVSSVPVDAVALPSLLADAPAAPVASVEDRPIELSAGFTIDVLELDELPAIEAADATPAAEPIVATAPIEAPAVNAALPTAVAAPVDSDWSDLIDDTPPPMPIAALAQAFSPPASPSIGLTDGAPEQLPHDVTRAAAEAVADVDAFESIEISAAFPIAPASAHVEEAPIALPAEPTAPPEPLAMSLDDLVVAPAEDAPAPLLVELDDIGLTPAVAEPIAEPIAEPVAEPATLADQWADAAERQIPRKENDRRNDVGWVPPSRELVVTPEPAAPAPEPVAAYTPAAPPVPVAAVAPWAVFAPAIAAPIAPVVVVEVPPTIDNAAPVAASEAEASNAADVSEAIALPAAHQTSGEAHSDVVDAAALQQALRDELADDNDPIDLSDDLEVADLADVADVVEPEPLDVGIEPRSVESLHVEPLDVSVEPPHVEPLDGSGEPPRVELLDVSVKPHVEPLDVSEPFDVVEPLGVGPLGVEYNAEPLNVGARAMVDDVPSAVATPVAPVVAAPVPAPVGMGWGELVDAPDVAAVAPELSPLAGISVPASLLPPATFTPPPAFAVPPGLNAAPPTLDLAAVDLGFAVPPPPPLASAAPDAHDDPFAIPAPAMPTVAPPPAPSKVTATMVMKLDPAEQKRLLEMLLARTEISPTELSQPPRPADPDEQK